MTATLEQAAPLVTEPAALFDFALDQLTWDLVREHLPLDETAHPYWTIAQCGPFSLLARAVTDTCASLDDWTDREESPDLYRKQDNGHLWHVGLIVEIAVHGILLAHESLWAIALDFSGGTAERESHEFLTETLRELTHTACQGIPETLSRKQRDLSSAAAVLSGSEAPYHRSLNF